jgi:hypothetical protein
LIPIWREFPGIFCFGDDAAHLSLTRLPNRNSTSLR